MSNITGLVMIEPVEIGEAQMVSSSVDIEDAPRWRSDGDYDTGEKALLGTDVYVALVENAAGQPDQSPDWTKQGAANRYKPFDTYLADPSTDTGQMNWRVRPSGYVDCAVVLRPKGQRVRVQSIAPPLPTYDVPTPPLVSAENVRDMRSFFFEERSSREDLVIPGIPPTVGGEIVIAIDNEPGKATSVAQIVLGRMRHLGIMTPGTGLSFQDFSFREADDFGRMDIIERDYADLVDFDLNIPTPDLRRVHRLIVSRRTKPTVFFAPIFGSTEGILVYGFPKDFSIITSDITRSVCSFRVEGLT